MKLPSAALTNRFCRSDGSLMGRAAGLHLNLDDLVADEQVGGLLVVDHGVDEAE